jgi:hypothetical protein
MDLSLSGLFLFGVLGWLASIRPETVVGLLVTFFFYSFVRFQQTRDFSYFLLAAAAGALGLSIHQSALALLAPAVVFLLVAVSQLLRETKRSLRVRQLFMAVIIPILWAFTLLGALIFQFQDFRNLVESYELWSNSDTHSEGIIGEVTRLSLLVQDSPFSFLIIAGLVGHLIAAVALAKNPAVRDLRSFSLTVALSPIGLAATASKWEWHYGALVGLASVGIVLAFAAVALEIGPIRPNSRGGGHSGELTREEPPTFRRLAARISSLRNNLGAILLIFAVSLMVLHPLWVSRPTALFNDFEPGVALRDWLRSLPGVTSTDGTPSILASVYSAASTTISWHSMLLPVVVGAGYFGLSFFFRSFQSGLLASSVGVATLLPVLTIATHIAPPFVDDWSEAGDRIADLSGHDYLECGPYTAQQIVGAISPLGERGLTVELSDFIGSSTSLSTSTIRHYILDGTGQTGELGMWVFNPNESLERLTVTARDRVRDQVFQTDVTPRGQGPGWNLVSFAAESNWEDVSAHIEVANDSPLFVTDLVKLELVNAADSVRDSGIFAGPYNYQFSHCGFQVGATGSFVEGFDFITPKTIYGRAPLSRLVEVSLEDAVCEQQLCAWERDLGLPPTQN